MDLLCYLSFSLPSVMSDSCSIVATFWERVDLLALLYVMFSCAFVTFPYCVLGHVLYFIASIPDLCILPSFEHFLLGSK